MQLIIEKEVEDKLLEKTMSRLKPEQRLDLGKLARKGIPKKLLMDAYSVSRTTVWHWQVQDLRTRFDIKRNCEGKITVDVEITILNLRTTFKWGTARIQQGLINLPEFMRADMEVCVQNFQLSRTSINNLLIKHKLNGYRKKYKFWKFFRAKYPNELWQLDLKRFKFEGKKYELLVMIDDYSRFILQLYLFDHSPSINEIEEAVKPLIKKSHPEKILTDNNPFGKSWGGWCKELGTEAIFAHPYYPQDKGKVERTIRNIAEEFVDLLSQFPKWFNGKCMEEWRCWFNEDRFHRGVKDYPANLYVKY
jgi:hypothetical protein